MLCGELNGKEILQRGGICIQGHPRWHNDKESICQYRRWNRCWFDPWVRKIPWSRKQQPTPVFFPGKFYGHRGLAGCSSWGHKKLDMTEHTHPHICMCIAELLSYTAETNTTLQRNYNSIIINLKKRPQKINWISFIKKRRMRAAFRCWKGRGNVNRLSSRASRVNTTLVTPCF